MSRAYTTVGPELDEGEPEGNIVADLEKRSGASARFRRMCTSDAVGDYCPNEADKLS
jgi:hypothetical protein